MIVTCSIKTISRNTKFVHVAVPTSDIPTVNIPPYQRVAIPEVPSLPSSAPLPLHLDSHSHTLAVFLHILSFYPTLPFVNVPFHSPVLNPSHSVFSLFLLSSVFIPIPFHLLKLCLYSSNYLAASPCPPSSFIPPLFLTGSRKLNCSKKF